MTERQQLKLLGVTEEAGVVEREMPFSAQSPKKSEQRKNTKEDEDMVEQELGAGVHVDAVVAGVGVPQAAAAALIARPPKKRF